MMMIFKSLSLRSGGMSSDQQESVKEAPPVRLGEILTNARE
jgi:hypothetical protein